MYLRFIILLISCFGLNEMAFSLETGSDSADTITLDKIGGIWITNGEHGYYRARVYRSTKSGLVEDTIKISEYSYKQGGHKPRFNYQLPEPGVKGMIGDITFRMIDGQRMLLYLDIETKAREVARIREVYLLSPGGKYTVMEKAQDIDNIPFK